MSLGQAIAIASATEDEHVKRTLVMNAQTQRQWEDFAIGNTAVKINLPKELSDELLKYHWCWIHPLFIFVYRPAFIRGMSMVNANSLHAPDPPYYSETLLKVMTSHCARFLNHSVHKQMYTTVPSQDAPVPVTLTSTEFMSKATEEARICLGLDTLKPSSIPTIQALLQQSAREIAFGRSSQGWLYSGMAFRMAFDMGIHLPSDKLQAFVKSLSTEDIEIRKRLFWSCYTWDKTVSIYLGRMTNFLPDTDGVPLTFMDDFSDTELWSPYFGEVSSESDVKPPHYPPTPGYVVSCFRQLCRLSIILNDLMHGIYSPAAAARRGAEDSDVSNKTGHDTPFMRVARDLREWWISLPPYLRIPPDQMPSLAPPTHIVSLNVLYHTTIILLHRPYILSGSDLSQPAVHKSYSACATATAAVHGLLMLQANTFGYSHLTYLNAYAAYIAATIAVLRFEREHQPGEDHKMVTQNLGLNFLLEVLQGCSVSMPALERSVAIIKKRMKAVLERLTHQTMHNLFPGPSHQQPTAFNMITPHQQELAQPTAFQQISNPYLHHDQQSSPSYAPQGIPMQWQSEVRSSLVKESSFGDEYLPAFPGQSFPVGSEHSFGSEGMVDPEARTALMGFNLDPHPRLNHSAQDWNFADQFLG